MTVLLINLKVTCHKSEHNSHQVTSDVCVPEHWLCQHQGWFSSRPQALLRRQVWSLTPMQEEQTTKRSRDSTSVSTALCPHPSDPPIHFVGLPCPCHSCHIIKLWGISKYTKTQWTEASMHTVPPKLPATINLWPVIPFYTFYVDYFEANLKAFHFKCKYLNR